MRSRLLAVTAASLIMFSLAACGSDDEPATDEATGCQYPETGDASRPVDLPPSDPETADAVTITTNRGDIGVTLAPDTAPCTVGSFLSLAEQGFFDDTKCHRLVPGFVLQCGDPTGTSTGGPGYTVPDELTGDETYPPGTLAMANTGQPNTGGSQFFIVLEGAELSPAIYTVFGQVDDAGLQIAEDIAAEGNGPDGVAPAEDVVIESIG